MKKQQPPEQSSRRKFWISVFLLLSLLFIGTIFAAVLSTKTQSSSANTALITISGEITGDSSGDVFSSGGASSTEIVRELEEARDDDGIKAVILEINSPGGSAVASDEIAQAVKDVRQHNKTVVAWVREVGASGAYWVASSSDHIVANRMSITGSIGVISSYMQFDQFLQQWNVSYNRLVAGNRKDIGDPFVNLTSDNRRYLQLKLDRVHDYFIKEVAHNRKMSERDVAELADGQFFLGVEAKDVGLVDELGGKKEAVAYIKKQIGEDVDIVDYAPEKGFLDTLLGVFSRSPQPSLVDLARNQQLTSDAPIPMLK